MKTFTFYGSIEYSEELINFIESLEAYIPEPEEVVNIYFGSCGGDYSMAVMTINRINKLNYLNKVVLHPIKYINSCGFIIFMKINAKKKIDCCQDSAMTHLISSTLEYRGMKNRYAFDVINQRDLQKINDELIQFYKEILFTEEELKHLTEGCDVYFDNERLKEIVKSTGLLVE